MSEHSDTPEERSNPVLWTVAMVAFIAAVAWWFAYMYGGGAYHAHQNPLSADAGDAGPVEPDHAALIQQLDDSDMVDQGKAVYAANCTACHGADGGQGSNAAARSFLDQEFVNGADPYSMYLTLKNGLGAGMPAQGGLSAEEKYAVIAYIREEFLAESNPSQYISVDDTYLAEGGPNGPWPAPGGGGGGGDGGSPASPGKDYQLTAPVAAAMARAERDVDRDAVASARARLRQAAAVADDPAVAAALQAIAEDEEAGAYVRALVDAAAEDRVAGFLRLLTDPGRDTYQPTLALLPRSRLAVLAGAIREGQ